MVIAFIQKNLNNPSGRYSPVAGIVAQGYVFEIEQT